MHRDLQAFAREIQSRKNAALVIADRSAARQFQRWTEKSIEPIQTAATNPTMSHAQKTNAITAALTALIESKNLRAMALHGAWGTGKTYLVGEFAVQSKHILEKAALRYAYISLFGLQSIADVRTRIAAASFAGAEKKWIKSVLDHIPFGGSFLGIDVSKATTLGRELIEQAVVRDLFICVDDLERAGQALRPQDVLGLISELTEQKGCKCLLVFNRTQLADQSTLRTFEEKVFDLTLEFAPAPADVMHLGLADSGDQRLAQPVFDAFGVANIRIIRRLEWVLGEIRKHTLPGLSKLWSTIVQHAAVMVILRFEHGYSGSQFQQILGRDEGERIYRIMEKDLPADARTAGPELPTTIAGPLDSLGYEPAGFDVHIVQLLDQGSLDHVALKAELATAVAKQNKGELNARHRGFYDALRAGFKGTAADFAHRVAEFIREDLSALERYDLSNACNLLLEFDSSPAARALVTEKLTFFVKSVPPEERAGIFKKDYPAIVVSGVLDAIPFEPKLKVKPIETAFERIAANPTGLDPEEFKSLLKYDDMELRDFLLRLEAPDAMAQIARARERLQRSSGGILSDDERTALHERFERVLVDIAKVSPLFRYKIERYATPRASSA